MGKRKNIGFGNPQGSKLRGLHLDQLAKLAQAQPKNAAVWQEYAKRLADSGRQESAIEAYERSIQLQPKNLSSHISLAYIYHRKHETEKAQQHLDSVLAYDSYNVKALTLYALIKQGMKQHKQALDLLERAEKHAPNDFDILRSKAFNFTNLFRYEEAAATYETLLKSHKDDVRLWNDTGNVLRDLGVFEVLDDYYMKAIELAPDNPVPFSNRITSFHYDPNRSREDIFKVCQEWQTRYAPKNPPPRPIPEDLSKGKRLRIGMFSDGFRKHPVGSMIISALENLNKDHFELFLYPTHNDRDQLTDRLSHIADKWEPIKHLNSSEFAQKMRDDKIDILIDLAGHNTGTKSQGVALQPAPLLVKWVGGLINTTGIDAMDYLISDHIETPPGDEEDSFYVEKLIRLPDDYIVFSLPNKTPPVGPLPALTNGYITLGCFNNPTKINQVTLAEWAAIMHQLPESRLLLKGRPYTSDSFCRRIIDFMGNNGISEERLIIEGPAPHQALLKAYNRVDIALDPWPYSGGLTTCEALLMGVPVVTLPGPTFAGRHSATHLSNAGLAELVTSSWDDYSARVVGLANDLESLATIRNHLRSTLLQSPVCDGKRFAKHLMTALRAIWQRYCEGKAPAALTFEKDGTAKFKGESTSVDVEVIMPDTGVGEFIWELSSKVVAIDNSSKLLRSRRFSSLINTNAFSVLAFDPRSLIRQPERFKNHAAIQLLPHTQLGDGSSCVLHTCLDPSMSSVLKPYPAERLPPTLKQSAQVLTKLPINTVALDSIEGLGSLDWLLLDELSDTATILEHGGRSLANALIIEARIAFQATHEGQLTFDELNRWATRHGFRFYQFASPLRRSHLPARDDLIKHQKSELVTADALFIPDNDRLPSLSEDKVSKLSFILHTFYGIRDLTYRLLSSINEAQGERYLVAEGMVSQSNTEHAAPALQARRETFVDTESAPLPLPEVTLPDAPFMSADERKLFGKCLNNATRYFEFGTGGSTLWAAERKLRVYGVDSDKEWIKALNSRIGEYSCLSFIDIGPTKEWGFPTKTDQQHKFPDYSRAIHQYDQPFDLILVDGRFRVACTLSAIEHALEHAPSPGDVQIFIHDFWNRPPYHSLLQFLEVIDRADTAAVFRIKESTNLKDVRVSWEQYAKTPT